MSELGCGPKNNAKLTNVTVLSVVKGKKRTFLALSIPTKDNVEMELSKKDVVTVEVTK